MLIRDIYQNEWECDCVGCAIAAGEIPVPGGMVAESEHFVLHQDPEVPIPGFLIVAAKAHIRSIAQVDAATAQELFGLVHRARMAMAGLPGLQGVTLIQEERSQHLHLWLLPRYAWMDTCCENSLATVRQMNAYAKDHWNTPEGVQEILATVDFLRSTIKQQGRE